MKYSKDIVECAVKTSISLAETMTKLGMRITGGRYSHLKSLIKKFDISTKHFLGQRSNKGITPNNKKHWSTFLINKSNGRRESTKILRRALLESGREFRCENCNLTTWLNNKITLQIDHIDGNFENNDKANLRFLCPNCHSQTETYSKKIK